MAPPHIILSCKSPVIIDESTIEANDSDIFDINTEYILGSSTDIESKLQVEKWNDNNEMEDDNLEDCNLKDNWDRANIDTSWLLLRI